MNAQQLIRSAEQRLMTEAHKGWKEASPSELHNAISGAAMEAVAPLWKKKDSYFQRPLCLRRLNVLKSHDLTT